MIKKTALSIIIFILCITLINIDSYAQDLWTGNINVFLGAKALEEDNWDPVEEHKEIGIMVDFKNENWPISIVIDF